MKKQLFAIILVASAAFVSCNQKQAVDVKEYSIEQFFKNKQVSGGTFSQDENRMLITSNESGIYNLYEINIADGTQKQITNSTVESYFAIDYVPGTNKILYSADKGGMKLIISTF